MPAGLCPAEQIETERVTSMYDFIIRDKKLTVGTTAQDVAVQMERCAIQNCHATAKIYFRSKDDGVAVSASTGMQVGPGETFPFPVSCGTLSVISDAAGADVRLLFLGIG
jgi:hypothetical protein